MNLGDIGSELSGFGVAVAAVEAVAVRDGVEDPLDTPVLELLPPNVVPPNVPAGAALMASTASGAAIAAKAGYPSIQVPAGFVSGIGAQTCPFGVTFTGRAWSEPVLLRLAYAFEQATLARRPPPGLPSLG